MKTKELLEALEAPEITGNALLDQQNWERHAIELGRRKVAKDLANAQRTGGFQSREDAQRVIKGALPMVALRVTQWIEENTRGQGEGRSHAAVQPLTLMDPDALALIALSSVFSGIAPKPKPIGSVATDAGRQVEVSLEAMDLKKVDEKRAKMLAKLIAKSAPTAGLTTAKGKLKGTNALHDAIATKADVRLGWDDEKRLRVGEPLLECVLQALPEIFERQIVTLKTREGYRSENSIVLTLEGAEYLQELQDALAWMNPKLLPMVVKPRAWERMDTGAYMDHAIAKTVPMVRTRVAEQKKLIREAISTGAMASMLDSLNALQNTGCIIDKVIREIEEHCFDNLLQPGGTDGSFPTKAKVVPTKPEKPTEISWAEWEEKAPAERFRASRMPMDEWLAMDSKFQNVANRLSEYEWETATPAKRKAISRRNHKLRQIALTRGAEAGVFKADMDTAKWLEAQPCFYQPHVLDSRGRIYTAAHFGHQGSDYKKALFRFAVSKPLGAKGGQWLMIHLANSGDFEKVSKRSFADRLDWVADNQAIIELCATDPMDPDAYAFWSKADNPFLFLQACMEFTAWALSGFSEDFMSNLPIALDGSCSGIQHYSAIMRSREEARHVNLLPSDVPQDLYGVVALKARPRIETQADPKWLEAQVAKVNEGKGGTKGKAEKIAQATRQHLAAVKVLENPFGRGTTKRNTMTYGYSAPEQGMRGQQMEDLMEPLQTRVDLGELEAHPYALEIVDPKHERIGESDGGSAAAACIAHHAYNAIVDTLPDAQRGMEWFQEVAGILAAEDKSVVMNTPMGFPVVSRYNEWDVKTVTLWLYDRKVPVLDAGRLDKVDEETGRVTTRIEATLRTNPKKKIDRKKARSAVAPNIIHSLDACHVYMTVMIALANGIDSFAMIHDSFATHAGDTELFFDIIRIAFVELYRDFCPFEEIARYARSVLSPEGLEALEALGIPEKGDLDLEEVRESLYAFA